MTTGPAADDVPPLFYLVLIFSLFKYLYLFCRCGEVLFSSVTFYCTMKKGWFIVWNYICGLTLAVSLPDIDQCFLYIQTRLQFLEAKTYP